MLVAVLWLVVGGVLLYVGAEGLIRGAVSVAERAGMAPLIIGLTVVAAGTSAPELVVSTISSLRGETALAIGNVLGSNICNLLLIAGVAALIRPMTIERTVVRREVPLMIGISVFVGGLMLWEDQVARWEGGLLLVLLAASTVWSIYTARKEVPLPELVATVPATTVHLPLRRSLLWMGLGLVGLVLGADRFVEGAVVLARALGLSEAVIGLTVIAIGTSLPELATSAVAAFKGESDLALGNIVGSNIFNLLGILGVASVIRPLPLPPEGALDIAVMIGVAVVVLPFARTGFCLQRWEGALLLTGYVGYIAWLLAR